MTCIYYVVIKEENERFLFDPAEYCARFSAFKNDQPGAVVFAAIVGVPYDESSPCQGTGSEIAANGCLDHEAMQINIDTFTYIDGSQYKHFEPACTRADAAGNDITSARPGRRYVEVAQSFKDSGYIYSICNEDWGPAMRDIAGMIAAGVNE